MQDDVILTHFQSAEILGIVIDANDSFDGRWQSLRRLCLPIVPSIPASLPREGLIAETDEGKRLGIWIMPDNQSRGMLETFMKFLVPTAKEQLWMHAEESTGQAKAKGAQYRAAHREKADICTWLAWQDEPGQSMGQAIIKNILNANAPYAAPFVAWFKALFEV